MKQLLLDATWHATSGLRVTGRQRVAFGNQLHTRKKLHRAGRQACRFISPPATAARLSIRSSGR